MSLNQPVITEVAGIPMNLDGYNMRQTTAGFSIELNDAAGGEFTATLCSDSSGTQLSNAEPNPYEYSSSSSDTDWSDAISYSPPLSTCTIMPVWLSVDYSFPDDTEVFTISDGPTYFYWGDYLGDGSATGTSSGVTATFPLASPVRNAGDLSIDYAVVANYDIYPTFDDYYDSHPERFSLSVSGATATLTYTGPLRAGSGYSVRLGLNYNDSDKDITDWWCESSASFDVALTPPGVTSLTGTESSSGDPRFGANFTVQLNGAAGGIVEATLCNSEGSPIAIAAPAPAQYSGDETDTTWSDSIYCSPPNTDDANISAAYLKLDYVYPGESTTNTVSPNAGPIWLYWGWYVLGGSDEGCTTSNLNVSFEMSDVVTPGNVTLTALELDGTDVPFTSADWSVSGSDVIITCPATITAGNHTVWAQFSYTDAAKGISGWRNANTASIFVSDSPITDIFSDAWFGYSNSSFGGSAELDGLTAGDLSNLTFTLSPAVSGVDLNDTAHWNHSAGHTWVGFQYSDSDVPTLPPGTYTVTVSADYGSVHDEVSYSFTVD